MGRGVLSGSAEWFRARRVAGVLAVAAVAVLTASCNDSTSPGCQGGTANTLVSDVATRLDNGQPVGTFHFTQDYLSNRSSNCAASGGQIHLTIISSASLTESFSYSVQGFDTGGNVLWSANGGVTRLPSGSAVDQGTIATSPAALDVGTIRVVLNSWSTP